jgi:hypothetical protein
LFRHGIRSSVFHGESGIHQRPSWIVFEFLTIFKEGPQLWIKVVAKEYFTEHRSAFHFRGATGHGGLLRMGNRRMHLAGIMLFNRGLQVTLHGVTLL